MEAGRKRGLVKLCWRMCTEMGTRENLWMSSKLAR